MSWPDPLPHDLAEVWDNAAALTARVCQRCGQVFGPPQLVTHPDDEAGAARIAEREGLELFTNPWFPKGMAIKMDPLLLDLVGCPGDGKAARAESAA